MSLPFPDVPPYPGVPALPRLAGVVYSIPGLGIALSGLLGNAAAQAQINWGIFGSGANIGTAVVTPDSVVDFGNRNEWEVSDFPVQSGSFATYNKVKRPFECSVRLTKGGSQSDRQNFLAQIDAIAGDTNLYTILTPEWAYLNCNVTRYEITRRGAAGAYFLDVDVYFIQIIQVTAQYTNVSTQTANAADPTAQPAVNQGLVNPQPIDAQALQNVLPALSLGG